MRELDLQEVRVAEDDQEQVVEVVGDPAGEATDRLQPLRLTQFLLIALALADVAPDDVDDRTRGSRART